MSLAMGVALSALVVVIGSLTLAARRRRRVTPVKPWTAHTTVRVLADQVELDEAVARALRTEQLAASRISGRLARYEGMTGH